MDEIEEIQDKFRIVGRKEELRKALAATRAKKHLLIEGSVGVGKTVVALAVTHYLNRPFYPCRWRRAIHRTETCWMV